MSRLLLALLTITVLVGLPCDRAVVTGFPAMAAWADMEGEAFHLVVDAFLQARGVAPGSPGFGWDRVEYKIIHGDVAPWPGFEIVIGGTVLPEDGFLAIYNLATGDRYFTKTRAVNLARVENLRIVDVTPEDAPGGPSDLAVAHSYNEMFGAFSRWERLLYLRFHEGELRSLLELALLDEAYSLNPLLAFRQLRTTRIESENKNGVEAWWRFTLSERGPDGEYGVTNDEEGRTFFVWNATTFSLSQRD